MPPVNVLGVNVDRLTPETLIQHVLAANPGEKPFIVMYANVHVLNTGRKVHDLRPILNSADIVYCDGSGVRLGARLLGHRIPPRMTGADWIEQLCAACVNQKAGLYLLGSRPEVAEQASEVLQTRYRGLHIVGTHHGYLQDPAISAAAITAINAARPHILFVGMGTPNQERWIFEHRHELDVPVVWAVGALFDFVAGVQRRAPRWMLDHGLEWLHRFWIDPRRLWRRYIVGNPLFICRVIMQRLGLLDLVSFP